MRLLDAKVVIPMPIYIVGTYDATGRPNVMTAAAGSICSTDPPGMAVFLGKGGYTHGNILARQAFTVSLVSETYLRQADYFGLVSGRDVDKFAATGLTPVRSDLVDAPYVGEFPLVVQCVLRHTIDLGSHFGFVGETLGIKASEAALDGDGNLDITLVRPVLLAPSNRAYFGVGEFLGKPMSIGEQIGRNRSARP